MKALMRLAAFLMVFFLLGILGGCVSLVFMDTTLVWRSLGAPPQKPVRIIDGDYRSVRVQTASGDIYYCHFKSPRQCWTKNDHPKYLYTFDQPFSFRNYDDPPALSRVVDTKKLYTSISEYSEVLSIYAITEKGKVYVWQDGYGSPYDGVIFIYVIPIAIVSGLVLWVLYELSGLLAPK